MRIKHDCPILTIFLSRISRVFELIHAFLSKSNPVSRAMKTLSAVTLALVVSAVGGMTNGVTAAPITYDFSGTASGDQALGASQTYTAAGGPTITAISGSYTQSGTGAPVAATLSPRAAS